MSASTKTRFQKLITFDEDTMVYFSLDDIESDTSNAPQNGVWAMNDANSNWCYQWEFRRMSRNFYPFIGIFAE